MEENKNLSAEQAGIEPEQPAENIPEAIIPSEEIILPQTEAAATELQTTNDKPQTSDMEVHHHGHVHEKKKWKEYVFQFFMLFLAVFCGFLAEYQLEHMIEHQREKKYMQSLLSDLAADTATLNAAYPRKYGRINAIDSVFTFFLQNPDTKTITGKMFRTIRRTNYDARFTRNNITINQLKNAGGMRLVRNKTVADSISLYDLRCEQANLYFDMYSVNAQVGNRKFEKLFNAADLLPFYIANTSGGIVTNIPDSIIIRINITDLNDELNFMMQAKAYARQETERFKELQESAERLIRLIKKEYNLK